MSDTTWTITFTPEDFDLFEYAVADYVAKWGEHLTGKPYQDPKFGPNIAGIPVAVANMAGTVLRKWVTERSASSSAASDSPQPESGPSTEGPTDDPQDVAERFAARGME